MPKDERGHGSNPRLQEALANMRRADPLARNVYKPPKSRTSEYSEMSREDAERAFGPHTKVGSPGGTGAQFTIPEITDHSVVK